MMHPRVIRDTVLPGLSFPEGPRWHRSRLWFSDMYSGAVVSMTSDGSRYDVVANVEHQPSGLGFLSDGTMLIVSMTDRRVLQRHADGTLTEYASLAHLAPFHCNDMVVDRHDNVFVGNFGFDLHYGTTPHRLTNLLLVRPDRTVVEAATDLDFPNGTVITPDGRTLIVGESGSGVLTAFDLSDDGSLTNRRVWAELPDGSVPDGICLDAEGAIWSACPRTGRVWRIARGGKVLDLAQLDNNERAFACMLGSEDRRTLYVCASSNSHPDKCAVEPTARIAALRVEVPGAGRP